MKNGEISLADVKIIKRNLNMSWRNKKKKQQKKIKGAKKRFVQY